MGKDTYEVYIRYQARKAIQCSIMSEEGKGDSISYAINYTSSIFTIVGASTVYLDDIEKANNVEQQLARLSRRFIIECDDDLLIQNIVLLCTTGEWRLFD